MITTRVIPAATATTMELLVEMSEKVCRPFCINSSEMPSGTIAFSAGTPVIINGNAVVTITATATVVSPGANACGCAATQVFTETFDVAFAETTANTIALTPGTTIRVTPTDVKCCKARGVKLTTSLEVAIS